MRQRREEDQELSAGPSVLEGWGQAVEEIEGTSHRRQRACRALVAGGYVCLGEVSCLAAGAQGEAWPIESHLCLTQGLGVRS